MMQKNYSATRFRMPRKTAMFLVVLVFMSSISAFEILDGTYQLESRTMMPHLDEMRRVLKNSERCLNSAKVEAFFPILNQPGLSACTLELTRQESNEGFYELRCADLNGATGQAIVKSEDGYFDARLSVTLGGKNMTFSQSVNAKRVGHCLSRPQ